MLKDLSDDLTREAWWDCEVVAGPGHLKPTLHLMAYGTYNKSKTFDLAVGRFTVLVDLPCEVHKVKWDNRFLQFCEEVWNADPISRRAMDVPADSSRQSGQDGSQDHGDGSMHAGSACNSSSIANTLRESSK